MKKGFTLVEILVAIGLFSIVIAIAVGGFANALHAQREVEALVASQSNASLALEQMAREVRSGYFFCSTTSTTLASGPLSTCGCQVSIDGSVWTCSALNFNNTDGQNVTYDHTQGGTLEKKIGNGPSQSITSDNIAVKNLTFTIFGALYSDGWDPRITIAMSVAPSSTDPALANNPLNLQTTVSARDCGNLVGGC